MNVETQTRVRKRTKQDGSLLLSLSTRMRWVQPFVLFVIFGTWFTAPLVFFMGVSLAQFLRYPGLFFVAAAVLAMLMTARWRGKHSGVVSIDPDRKRIVKKRGLSLAAWSEIDLPGAFIALQDRYTRESGVRQTSSIGVRTTHGQDKETIHRLAAVPVSGTSEPELQRVRKAIDAQQEAFRTAVYGMGRAAPLPQGATLIVEGYSYSLCRALGEALVNAFGSLLYDVASLVPSMQGAADQSVSFPQRVLERGDVDLAVRDRKPPPGVRAKRRGDVLVLKTRAIPTGTAVAAGVATPVVMSLIYLLASFLSFRRCVLVPIAYLVLGLCLAGFTHRSVVDAKGLRIRLTVFGVLPLWSAHTFAWNEIGDLRTVADQGRSVLALISRTGEGRLGHLVLPRVDAGEWVVAKIGEYLHESAAYPACGPRS